MQQIQSPNLENLPNTGYYVSKDNRKEEFYKNESHIHKQSPLSGLKAGAHKLSNDIFTYFPKGFQGSKNSDFYEFLSLGMFPYIMGSLTMVASYCFGKKSYNLQDALKTTLTAKNVAAGAALYALGKWISPKLSRTLIHASTGANLDMIYINKVNELPEGNAQKGKVRIQYPKVFDSVDFYRKDLIEKQGELEENNMYAYYDKTAKKAGFKKKLNGPNQEMGARLRELKARATALENINKYVVAALGVVLGYQKAFTNIKFEIPKTFQSFKHQALMIPNAIKESLQDVWKDSKAGKALIIASLAVTLLDWLIPTLAFKSHPDTIKTKLDPKKESEVC